MIGDGSLFDDLARAVEDADGMLLVPEVEADGDGREFRFHGDEKISQGANPAASCLLI
jgi:hypothetical protein